MQYLSFTLEEDGVWRYGDMEIYELPKHRWMLRIGTTDRVCLDIYEIIGILYKEGMCVTFQLPESAEDLPSKCG